MGHFMRAALTFVPLLSILSLSPAHLDKAPSRDIASIRVEKAESYPNYQKAAAKIDSAKIAVAEDANLHKFKVKTFDLRESLNKVDKGLKPDQKDSKELQELLPKIVAAEKELKKLKDDGKIKDSDKSIADKDLNSLKMIAEVILGKLDKDKKEAKTEEEKIKKVVFAEKSEPEKDHKPVVSEEPKKEEEKEKFAFEITKIEEPKKDICTVDHNKGLSDQMNQLTMLVANLANTVAQNSQLMNQFLMAQQNQLQQIRPSYASPNTNWVYSAPQQQSTPQQAQSSQPVQQSPDYTHNPQLAFNPNWQLAQQYNFDPRFALNNVTPGPFGNAPFSYNFSQGQTNLQQPMMASGTLGAATYQGQNSSFNIPLTRFF